MITSTGMPLTERLRAVINRRIKQAIDAEREIARLQQRITALQTENQLLSYRLAEAEKEQNQ
jgi:hypothetical protein